MISMDRGIEYEQSLTDLPVAVILLQARSNTMKHLRPLVPDILASLRTIQPRTLVGVGDPRD